MKETWKYNLIDLIWEAGDGKKTKIDKFLKTFSPFAVINEDYSVLLVMRHFHATSSKEKISVLSSPPKKDFQWGITIVEQDDIGAMETDVYLPNSFNYSGINIKGREIEIFSDGDIITKTNVTELFRKLQFYDSFSKDDIDKAFKSLCNEDFDRKASSKTKVKDTVIKLPSVGELKYNEKYLRYEGVVKLKDHSIDISVSHCTPKKMEKLIAFVDDQIKSKFYLEILLQMEDEMVKLKNEDWLEENESGTEETPITPAEFRKRISISSIDFDEDCSSTIYCNDGDIFWGHTIQINVDKKGKYQDADLAG